MLLVHSANDMAVVLAEGVSGSIEKFADDMNAAARQLGMTQTHYVNPNGLPDEGQITSARDLAILARALIREFPEYDYFWHIPSIRLGKRIYGNTNRLIESYPGADGMKTGFICASGYNLVATATRGDRRLIAVVLGAQSSGQMRGALAAQLLERGFSQQFVVSWLQPSLGTVNNRWCRSMPRHRTCATRCAAASTSIRPVMRTRKLPSAPAPVRAAAISSDVVFRGRAAAADDEAVGTAGVAGRGLRTDPGIYRSDPNRRGVDRRRGGRRGTAEPAGAPARQEARCGKEGRRG